jgi:tRNA(Ile)-lysidine synthase
MLAALAALRDSAPSGENFVLRCLHVEHGIRPEEESRGDAFAVKSLCRRLKVPCKIVFIPPGKIVRTASRRKSGIEAAARFFRHRIWNGEAGRLGAWRVLAAHTRDDLLETLLMRFLRGSGPAGLASMPVDTGLIFRPLLELGRQDVLTYLKEKGLSYRDDSTNTDTRFLRNRIRHRLIPCLDDFFPFWRSSLLSLGKTQALTAAFLSSEAGKRLPWEGGEELKIPLEVFFRESAIIREEAFFQAVDRLLSGTSVRRTSLRRFLAEMEKGKTAGDLGPVRLERKDGYLVLTPTPEPETTRGFSLLIKKSGSYTLKGMRIIAEEVSTVSSVSSAGRGTRECSNFFAALPLVLRPFHAGQKHRFPGIAGNIKGLALIAAEDAGGIAALIRAGKTQDGFLLYSRDREEGPCCFKFTVSKAKH